MMARHGENIRKRADGRWEGRYPVYSEEKEQQVYRSVYGKTYREAKEKLNARKSGLSDQELAIGGRILLAQAAQEWLAEIQDTRKKSTYFFNHEMASYFSDSSNGTIVSVFPIDTNSFKIVDN